MRSAAARRLDAKFRSAVDLLPAFGVADPVASIHPHRGRREGRIERIDDSPGLLFGPVLWVRYADGLDHHTADELAP